MRALVVTLFVGYGALVVWSFAVAPRRGWWLSPSVTSYGPRVDALFTTILWIVGAFFVLTLGLLVWSLWRHGEGGGGRARAASGNPRLELFWTLVPGAILLWLCFAQAATWKEIKFDSSLPRGADGSPQAPLAEVRASQFDWRFAYPGADGRLGTSDDPLVAGELVVPAGEKVVLRLLSRDVIHSFFVPRFRLKQDILPARAALVWFECDTPGRYELVCAELCGFGHGRMAGMVRVVPRAEYEAWCAALEREQRSNGTEDAR